MNDPVSRELEARSRVRQPWILGLVAAVALHGAVAAALVVLPEKTSRALTLPSVQVRLRGPEMPAAPPEPEPAPPATVEPAPPPSPEPPPPQPEPVVPRPAVPPVERRPSPTPAPTAVPAPPAPPRPAPSEERRPMREEADPPPPAAGGVGLRSGSRGATDEDFPFAYYLDRVLVAIEGNWFRPAVPADTRCRIRCRIDRTGRILEAGIEDPSGIPAFDRAALRAVYAAAPFPPLPQSYGGSTLTLHLEFSQ